MKEATITLTNEEGLHARPAALFVRRANKYVSDITLVIGDEEVNGKSIIGIMSLGVYSDQEITIQAEGSDEQEAIDGLCDLIKNDFK